VSATAIAEAFQPAVSTSSAAIRRKDVAMDWTVQLMPDAGMSDLSLGAIRVVRVVFVQRNSTCMPKETCVGLRYRIQERSG
jgi:hypothetical protein